MVSMSCDTFAEFRMRTPLLLLLFSAVLWPSSAAAQIWEIEETGIDVARNDKQQDRQEPNFLHFPFFGYGKKCETAFIWEQKGFFTLDLLKFGNGIVTVQNTVKTLQEKLKLELKGISRNNFPKDSTGHIINNFDTKFNRQFRLLNVQPKGRKPTESCHSINGSIYTLENEKSIIEILDFFKLNSSIINIHTGDKGIFSPKSGRFKKPTKRYWL